MKTTFEIAVIIAVLVLTTGYAFIMTEPYVINLIMNRA